MEEGDTCEAVCCEGSVELYDEKMASLPAGAAAGDEAGCSVLNAALSQEDKDLAEYSLECPKGAQYFEAQAIDHYKNKNSS